MPPALGDTQSKWDDLRTLSWCSGWSLRMAVEHAAMKAEDEFSGHCSAATALLWKQCSRRTSSSSTSCRIRVSRATFSWRSLVRGSCASNRSNASTRSYGGTETRRSSPARHACAVALATSGSRHTAATRTFTCAMNRVGNRRPPRERRSLLPLRNRSTAVEDASRFITGSLLSRVMP